MNLRLWFLNKFFPIINTKRCNKCRSNKLVLLRSTNEKLCSNCGNSITWHLDEGQKSLITNNRVR